MKKPRILIISRTDYFNDKGSEANTIRSFMSVFPKEDVFSILCGDFNIKQPGRIDDNTFQLCHNDLKYFNSLLKGERNSNATILIPSATEIRNKTFRERLKSLAVNIYSLIPYRVSSELRDFINECDPDIIYTTFTNYREMSLVMNISKKWNLPIVPHFFDDWPNVYYDDSTFKFLFKKFFYKRVKHLLHKAPVCFCISDRMCMEYKNRYGVKKTIQLLNTVYKSKFEGIVKPPKVLLYVGSLYLGRGDALWELCKVIKKKNQDLQLRICAPVKHWRDYESKLGVFPFVEYKGFLTEDSLFKEIEIAGALLFVESFDNKMLDYTRLSLSTRIPEFLSYGKPIIAMGHEDQGSIAYLKQNKVAYVIDDISKIETELKRVLELKDFDIMLNKANFLFDSRHERGKQQLLFYKTICDLIQ